jgi:hypothetical protein
MNHILGQTRGGQIKAMQLGRPSAATIPAYHAPKLLTMRYGIRTRPETVATLEPCRGQHTYGRLAVVGKELDASNRLG